jgi:DNA-binding NarL/FixJ family response regulator
MFAKNMVVFICEDHEIVVDGISRILLNMIEGVQLKSFKSGDAMLKEMGIPLDPNPDAVHDTITVPDLLILDINLPEKNGIDILQHIRKHQKTTKVLILTMYNDAMLAKKLKDLGANGYLLKDFGEEEFVAAVKVVYKGNYFESPSLIPHANASSETKALYLTSREKDIIKYTVLGKSSIEIGELLFLSPHTVNTHRRNIYKKLNIGNIKELVNFAHVNGLS